jgi:hypothetical protein
MVSRLSYHTDIRQTLSRDVSPAAIIQADANRYGGANACTLWTAFAKRGLGYGELHPDF